MLTGVEDTNLRPIKDPIALKKPVNWYRWTLAVILFFLLLLLLILWRKRIRKEPFGKKEVSEYQSAKGIAIVRLKELKKLITSDNKTFYLQTSFILREFIENQYYIRALEMTTNEISEFKPNYTLNIGCFTNLINLLNRADLAKFAKFEFTTHDRQDDYKWILNFISNFDD